MISFLVFNGDADGICAAHQFYLDNQQNYEIVTGVKRDIALLQKIEQVRDADINVFDIAVEKNIRELNTLLDQNCRVVWFDHHISRDIPEHRRFESHIQTDADMNTSLIVSRYLQNPLSRWAIVGLFGDNMTCIAKRMARSIGLNESRIQQLEEMGELLNYNAYGSSEADLSFPPAEVLHKLKPFDDPFDFLRTEKIIEELSEVYKDDINRAEFAEWLTPNIVHLPDEKWARRVVGDFSYQLVRRYPEKDFAVLLSKGGNYQVSIRASINGNKSAGDFCLQFPTGGGREKAGGINELPIEILNSFIDRFNKFFL